MTWIRRTGRGCALGSARCCARLSAINGAEDRRARLHAVARLEGRNAAGRERRARRARCRRSAGVSLAVRSNGKVCGPVSRDVREPAYVDQECRDAGWLTMSRCAGSSAVCAGRPGSGHRRSNACIFNYAMAAPRSPRRRAGVRKRLPRGAAIRWRDVQMLSAFRRRQ